MPAKRPTPSLPEGNSKRRRMIRVAGALCALICLASSVPVLAENATALITVRLENVSPKGGNLRVSLYDKANYSRPDGEAIVDMVVPAKSPQTDVVFPPVPPGVYAIKMFQDFNKNGEFDFT